MEGVAPPTQWTLIPFRLHAMDLLVTVSVLLLLCSVVATAIDYDPSPNPEAVVQVGKARFTVLTDHLVRMEWGGTNDAATLAFINRNLPTPKFTTSKDGNWTIIQTSAVEVLRHAGSVCRLCSIYGCAHEVQRHKIEVILA